MIFTLFLSPLHQTWTDNVTDSSQARDLTRYLGQVRHNILYQKIEQYALDATDTRSISYANYASTDWVFIIAKVVGEAQLNTNGFDTDGSTPITAEIPVYGTSLFPGYGIFSTYNLTDLEIESLADSTTVELYAAIAAEDDDVRIDQNT